MIIRDSIYVDADRVYSLYSQVFEGVAERIVQSSTSTLTTSESIKGPTLSGKQAETRGNESLQRTESRVLYDHIYNQLETRLGENLEVIDETTEASNLTPGHLVKATGVAEVEDYARLARFITNFNEMGEAIAYSISQSAGLKDTVEALEAAANSQKDRNQRAKAKMLASTAKEQAIKKIARDSGLHQEKRLIDSLKLFTDIFNPDGLEVVITPTSGEGQMVVKAVLGRHWLRLDANYLRTLYAGMPAANWTVVGHITHRRDFVDLPQTSEAGPSSMRTAFRNMFRANREVERLFFESNDREEVIVLPLAIYRETQLTDPMGA